MCCGGDTEKVLWITGEQRRQGVYCYFSVSELHCQQLLLLPENADSDCRRQNCCFYSLHRCKPDESRYVTACMKRAEFSKLKDPPIHTQVLNVFQATGQYSVLSLSLHVRLCKYVQKITWADGNQQWQWHLKSNTEIYINDVSIPAFISICNQVSNPC